MSFKSSGTKTRPDRVKPVTSVTAENRADNSIPVQSRSRQSSVASSAASFHPARFPPEEEAQLLSASNELKAVANAQFAKSDYSSALSTYDKAVAECPNYLDYELALLSSNIAACHIKMEEWKEALEAAERGMDGLDHILPMPKSTETPESHATGQQGNQDASQTGSVPDGPMDKTRVVELSEDNTVADDEQALRDLELSDQRRADIHRIRTKLLLRRARARYMLGTSSTKTASKAQAESIDSASASASTSTSSTWSTLSSAQADYHILSTPLFFQGLPASDKKTVRAALATLQPLIEQAKDREVKEMMGKLKELGNGILRPFGLSTDMFKMEKDQTTGGMSLKFDSGK